MSRPLLFYFAWVNAGATFGPAHEVEDEDIVAFRVRQDEGDFAKLTIWLKASRTKGLLAVGHKQWMIVSWESDTTAGVQQLFYGRVTGLATDMAADLAQLTFFARPADFEDLKRALADALRVLPYYDPLCVEESERDNPDVVLNGYSARWHIDRVTLAVTASDIIVGEGGTAVFTEADIPFGKLGITLGQAPLRQVAFDLTVTWDQRHAGSFAVPTPGISSYTAEGVASGWPKPGTSLADGLTAGAGTLAIGSQVSSITGSYKFEDKSAHHENNELLSHEASWTIPIVGGGLVLPGLDAEVENDIVIGDEETGRAASSNTKISWTTPVMVSVGTRLTADYDAHRARREHLSFVLVANFQPILTDAGAATFEKMSIPGGDVGLDVVRYDTLTGVKTLVETMPIVDPSRRAYFPTARGLQTVQNAILLARARLLNRARAVKITFPCTFERAIGLSCRMNVVVTHRRIPGGVALGKITSYEFGARGGVLDGLVTIECSIGYGTAVVAADGTPTYASADYVGANYQRFAGDVNVLSTSDVGFSTPVDAPNDDGLTFPLDADQIVVRSEVVGAVASAPESNSPSSPDPADGTFTLAVAHAAQVASIAKAKMTAVEAIQQWIEVEFKPLNGAFEVSYDITVTEVDVAKQVDLGSTA